MTNIAATRYLTSTRVDLSSVFMPLSFGGQYSETGYQISSGADLNTLFCQKYLSTAANKTSLLLSDGQDLSDVFEKRHAVGYSTIAYSGGGTTPGGTNPAIRIVYPLSSSAIYFGGDSGTLRVWSGGNTSSSTNISGLASSSGADSVWAIYARTSSNVYVGGAFDSANGGNTNMAYLARYNGTFNQVGGVRVNASVLAMYGLDPSNVYIGGAFTNGGTMGTRITRLNTYSNSFTPLTSSESDVSLNSSIRTIFALDISNVYIGGGFTNGDTIGKYITRWDGEKFNRLGYDDLSGSVLSIHALDPSHVYLSGTFTKYGSDTRMSKIAMWNGETMTSLGNGIDPDIRSMYALDENHVYIGGGFDHLKMWNGRDYITLAGTGSFSLSSVQSLRMLTSDKTFLYLGGGGQGESGIQKWTT